jgi:hypothetical protein
MAYSGQSCTAGRSRPAVAMAGPSIKSFSTRGDLKASKGARPPLRRRTGRRVVCGAKGMTA